MGERIDRMLDALERLDRRLGIDPWSERARRSHDKIRRHPWRYAAALGAFFGVIWFALSFWGRGDGLMPSLVGSAGLGAMWSVIWGFTWSRLYGDAPGERAVLSRRQAWGYPGIIAGVTGLGFFLLRTWGLGRPVAQSLLLSSVLAIGLFLLGGFTWSRLYARGGSDGSEPGLRGRSSKCI